MESDAERWTVVNDRLIGLSVCITALAKALADEKPEFGHVLMSRLDEMLDFARVHNWPSGTTAEVREQKMYLQKALLDAEQTQKPSPRTQS